ncbi:hypothetical protein ASF71_07515 [Deinococcus sp. Leaf326]|nr:hypothetical protein ASF71_07515 [Deinococcus sp. Leaf326]
MRHELAVHLQELGGGVRGLRRGMRLNLELDPLGPGGGEDAAQKEGETAGVVAAQERREAPATEAGAVHAEVAGGL